jgi:hypothetical protein
VQITPIAEQRPDLPDPTGDGGPNPDGPTSSRHWRVDTGGGERDLHRTHDAKTKS